MSTTTTQDSQESSNSSLTPWHHQQQHHANMFVGSMAKSYTSRTGGCNIQLANHLISLSLPYLPPQDKQKGSSAPLRILDNASGPLVLTNQILQTPEITSAYSPIHISAVDLSADFVRENIASIATLTSTSNTTTTNAIKIDAAIMDGTALDFADEVFDASFTSLAIFAFPDPVKGAREIYRTLKPGGVAALTTWKSVSWLGLLRDVERAVKSSTTKGAGGGGEGEGEGSMLLTPTNFPMLEAWMVPGKLSAVLREGGFRDVEVEEGDVDVVAWYEDLEALAGSLSETLRLMVGDQWTGGEKERMEGGFLGLFREMVGRGDRGAREGLRFEFEEGEEGKGNGRVGMEMCAFTAVARK